MRHFEALFGYQREMISYLTNSGNYRKYPAQEDKDRMLMDRILEVWNNNGKLFPHNMAQITQNNDKNTFP
ncbi:MAG: hypothetical protein Q4C66_11035 [Lachnospiraceae bacterium]|nr:hypothetical protein [Lachnospiraceae bacterium]